MKKYNRIIIVLSFSAICLLGFIKLRSNKEIIDEKAQMQEVIIKEIPVSVETVNIEKINSELAITGNFEARKSLSVIAESQGVINTLKVSPGQTISKGQIIAVIDASALKTQLMSAQASLDKSEKDVERYQNLLNVGAISQTQFEDVQLGMKNQLAQIANIQQQIQYTSAKAPMNGTISEIFLEEGSFVNLGTQIASIIDISTVNLIVTVDEKSIVKVKNQQKVNITTEVYPNQIFIGTVNQIGIQADASRKYEISISLTNDSAFPIKAGMYGKALIPIGDNQNKEYLTIPRKSVVGSVKQPQVYLAINGKAVLTNIEIGEAVGEKVIVTNGLQQGDKVITTGQINLDNGRAIKAL